VNCPITGLRLVEFGEHSAHDVSVDVDTESVRDDQRNPWAAKAWISTLEFDNSVGELGGWSIRFRQVDDKNQYRLHSREDKGNGGAVARLSIDLISIHN
jgi:hypothetical protein